MTGSVVTHARKRQRFPPGQGKKRDLGGNPWQGGGEKVKLFTTEKTIRKEKGASSAGRRRGGTRPTPGVPIGEGKKET